MKTILSYLGSVFKSKDSSEPVKPTQASKIEAAHQALLSFGNPREYKLSHRASDSKEIQTITSNIIEHNEVLIKYLEKLNDDGSLSYSDIVRTHGTYSLSAFLTQDGYYIPSIEIYRFHVLATAVVAALYEHREDQTGKGAHAIRLLGNCFVSITSVCNALLACKAKK